MVTMPVSNDEQWTMNKKIIDGSSFNVHRPNDTGIFTVTERQDL